MLAFFDQMDSNKDGLLLKKEVFELEEKVKEFTGKDALGVRAIRGTLNEFCNGCGITETGIQKKDWVENFSKFLVGEIKKMNEGKKRRVGGVQDEPWLVQYVQH